MYRLVVEENDAGQRLDRFLRKYLRRAPLSAIYRIIRKDLKVNGKRGKEDQMLRAGDELTFYMAEEVIEDYAKATKPKASKRRFKIAYEDENFLIAVKPTGLLTHGDSKEKSNTLTNQVCGYLQQKGEYDPARERTFHPSPVNRLDRNTSGLVIFGKNAKALRQMAELLRRKDYVKKLYRTILCGILEKEQLVDEALIKDSERNMVSVGTEDEKARESQTKVMPIRAGSRFTSAEVELITGRTHQIRVHMAHIGHPLAGDPKYGDARVNRNLKELGIGTQLLHAWKLEFSGDIDVDEYDALDGLKGKIIEAELPPAYKSAEEKLLSGQ